LIDDRFIFQARSIAMRFICCHLVLASNCSACPTVRFILSFQDVAWMRNGKPVSFWTILLVVSLLWRAGCNRFARLSHWFLFKIGSRLMCYWNGFWPWWELKREQGHMMYVLDRLVAYVSRWKNADRMSNKNVKGLCSKYPASLYNPLRFLDFSISPKNSTTP
jgi:hypothetical protein